VEERTSAVEAAVREELARFRLEIAAERRTAIEELAASNSAERDALTTANAAFVEDVRKLTDGFNDSMEIVRAEIESVESKVSARIEELRAHIDGQRPAAPTDAQASDKQSGDDVTLIFG
jgi:hypothetical protein